jgi:hypothetical protein
MGPVPLRVLANLERVAVREKQDQSVITYRITREGAYQAMQRGETLSDIRGYLEEATGQQLPQNIARSLEEWGAQHERIILRRDVQILQVASNDILDTLLQDAVVRRILHRLDANTGWIQRKDAGKLEKRLKMLNMLPSHSVSFEVDLKNCLRWEGEQLVSRSPLPSLYVIGTMQQIAESAPQSKPLSRWDLTENSVRHACENGYETIDIIKMIEKMTGESVSSQWQKRIKAWGNYYGESYTAQVRLIRFESQLVLQELRSLDPRLEEWLQPLTQSEAIAVVNQVDLEKILELLASYGIPLREEEWW